MPASDSETPSVRSCGTMQVHERLLRSVPSYAAARSASETRAWEFATGARGSQRAGVTVIPVVVHVVWNTNPQNISDAQIQSQIAILNQDFRKLNVDLSITPAVFQPLCGDARVEFALATTDPSANPTTGIVRTKTTKASFSDDDTVKATATGGSDAWPADKYLNLWVCQLGGGLLGYAQFPGGPAATDGVVIRHSAFGNTGTAAAPFHLGRTATHEIGHWLNLRHIWGDDGNGCSGDDFVADTPNCAGANTGIPGFPHVTCNNGPNGDLFMNYMDYTDDAGMVMFTNGQVNRLQACLDTDRPTIGHTKPGPTLAFADVKPTLAVLDVKPTLASADIKPTIAIIDVKPTIAQVDVKPTLMVIDVKPTIAVVDIKPTLAQIDSPHTLATIDLGPTIAQIDLGPTIAQIDLGPTIAQIDLGPTIAQIDLGPTIAQIDLGPTLAQIDVGGQTVGAFDLPPSGPMLPNDPGPMPFVLATPHHTNAWIGSHRALRDQQIESLAQEGEQLEEALTQLARAEAEGRLSATEAATAEQLHAEYQRVMAELGELGAFEG